MTIDVEGRRVRTPSGSSSLEPKVFALLLILTDRPGLTASRDHLVETVWGRAKGADGALNQAVALLRRALGDDARAPRFIETVPDLGYRWIFEEPPERSSSPTRWSVESAWAAAGAMLAIAVGGAGAGAAYARVRNGESDVSSTRKIHMQRAADGCRQGQAERAPVRSASPGCPPPDEPRTFVER